MRSPTIILFASSCLKGLYTHKERNREKERDIEIEGGGDGGAGKERKRERKRARARAREISVCVCVLRTWRNTAIADGQERLVRPSSNIS